MLDEPSAGVSPIVLESLFQKIVEIAQQGTAVLNGGTKCQTSFRNI